MHVRADAFKPILHTFWDMGSVAAVATALANVAV